MFAGEWTKDYRLEHYVNGLLWLLQNPNPDSALNGGAVERNLMTYAMKVQLALHGFTVNNIVFKPSFVEGGEDASFEPFPFELPDLFNYIFTKLQKASLTVEVINFSRIVVNIVKEFFVGEFSFLKPKYPAAFWLESLKKMKAEVVKSTQVAPRGSTFSIPTYPHLYI
jgi:hypothetical protein